MAGWLYSPCSDCVIWRQEMGLGRTGLTLTPPFLPHSVDDVQVSCYRTLCSIYSLGTTRNPYVEK